MQKNYCDRCGKELHHREGYFIKPIKNYKVLWLDWDVVRRSQVNCFDKEELCEKCFTEFCELLDNFYDVKKEKDNDRK